MTASARVLAQAKINLRLCVLARESTGYHSIETIFLRLELGDDVRVRVAAGRSIDCAGPAIPAGGLGPAESNLAFRAAAAYADTTGWPAGFSIEIDKRIPVGGGLGGGSADAGAVLRALDALSPRPLGQRLIELAVPLGADVPFMATQHAMAVGWGHGERLLALTALEPRRVVLAMPGIAIATPDAYGWLDVDRPSYAPRASTMDLTQLSSWQRIRAIAANDFQEPVARHHPIVAQLTRALAAAGASIAMLSGSGATVFGVFEGDRVPTLSGTPNNVTFTHTRTSQRAAPVDTSE